LLVGVALVLLHGGRHQVRVGVGGAVARRWALIGVDLARRWKGMRFWPPERCFIPTFIAGTRRVPS
jgi:hypothetical protein